MAATRFTLRTARAQDQDALCRICLLTAQAGGDPGPQAWPAHFHLNLLPAAQGQGWGRRHRDAGNAWIFVNDL